MEEGLHGGSVAVRVSMVLHGWRRPLQYLLGRLEWGAGRERLGACGATATSYRRPDAGLEGHSAYVQRVSLQAGFRARRELEAERYVEAEPTDAGPEPPVAA